MMLIINVIRSVGVNNPQFEKCSSVGFTLAKIPNTLLSYREVFGSASKDSNDPLERTFT